MSVYRPKSVGQNHDLSAVIEEVKEKWTKSFQPQQLSQAVGMYQSLALVPSPLEILTVTTKSSCSRYLCSVSSSSLAVRLRFLSHRALCSSTVFAPAMNSREESLMVASGPTFRKGTNPDAPREVDTQQKNSLCCRVRFWATNSTLYYERKQVNCQQSLLTFSFCTPTHGYRSSASTTGTELEKPDCEKKSSTLWYVCKLVSSVWSHSQTTASCALPHSSCRSLNKPKEVSGWKKRCRQSRKQSHDLLKDGKRWKGMRPLLLVFPWRFSRSKLSELPFFNSSLWFQRWKRLSNCYKSTL